MSARFGSDWPAICLSFSDSEVSTGAAIKMPANTFLEVSVVSKSDSFLIDFNKKSTFVDLCPPSG